MGMLKGLMKELKNPYASIAEDGLICGDISGYIDTGIYILNGLVSGKLKGGFPKGKVVALAGQKGTGKTFILLNALRHFLNDNEDGKVIFFESEGALTKEMMVDRGLDVSRIGIFPVSTVEDLRNQSLKTLDYMEKIWKETGEFPNVVMCLDSLGMLGTEFEVSTSRENDNKADMGKRAQLIKSVFRNITLKLALLQIPMILTNHTYQGMGKYDPVKMSGGQGPEFAASIIIFLAKAKIKDGKDAIANLIGNNITFHVHKGRLTMEGSKATVGLNFKGGIGRYNGLLKLLVSAGVIIQKGAWYSYKGDNVSQGEANFYDHASEIITDEMIEELEPFVAETFMYGVVDYE